MKQYSEEVIYPEIQDTDKSGPLLLPPAAEDKMPSKPKVDVKKYAWRITAIYVWLKLIFGYFLGWQSVINQAELGIVNSLVNAFKTIGLGFAPISDLNLVAIIKFSWLIIITGVKPLQFLGLVFYIFFFPLLCVAYVIGSFVGVTKSEPENVITPERKVELRERLRLALSALFLIVWLLLYGEATTLKQVIPGVVLSGIFLILITYRLFQRSRPISKLRYFRPLVSIAHSASTQQSHRLERFKGYTKQSEMKFDLLLFRFYRNILIRIAILMRGKRGRRRVLLFVLGEYVLSFRL